MEGNSPLLLCFTLYLKSISKYKSPGRLIFGGGQFNGGFFALRVWGPTFGGDYFRNSTVVNFVLKFVLPVVLKEIHFYVTFIAKIVTQLSLSLYFR